MIFKNRLTPLILSFLFLSTNAYGAKRTTKKINEASSSLQTEETQKTIDKYEPGQYSQTPILFELAQIITSIFELEDQYQKFYTTLSSLPILSKALKIEMKNYSPLKLKFFSRGYIYISRTILTIPITRRGYYATDYIENIPYDKSIIIFFHVIFDKLNSLKSCQDPISAINKALIDLITTEKDEYRENLSRLLISTQSLYSKVEEHLKLLNDSLSKRLDSIDRDQLIILLQNSENTETIEEINLIMESLKKVTSTEIYAHEQNKPTHDDHFNRMKSNFDYLEFATWTQFFPLLRKDLIAIFDQFEKIINRLPKTSNHGDQSSDLHILLPSSTNLLE